MSSREGARPRRAKVGYALTVDEDARRDELMGQLSELGEALAGALETFGEALELAWSPVEEAASAYNATAAEAREFAEDVATSRREVFENRSERWRESDEGERASSWIEQWESAENNLGEIELERPEPPDEPDLSHEAVLGDLPGDSED